MLPQDPTLRAIWIQPVQRTRADSTGPSDQSVVCSKNFTKDCFEKSKDIAADFGIKMRWR